MAGDRCPICEEQATVLGPIVGWGDWRRCERCSLDFADPINAGRQPEELFTDAYRGNVSDAKMGEFSERLLQRGVYQNDPSLWFWTPAFEAVGAWLKQRVEPGATVLEIGCGLGFFLRYLRQSGFRPVGIDPAEPVIDLAREDGLEVYHGTLDTAPPEGIEPAAIVCFFMLHHIADPVSFFATIRRRWPNTPIAVAQYGPSNKSPLSSDPPRTLTRWETPSLEAVFRKTGYRPASRSFRSTGVERLKPIRRVLRPLKPRIRIVRALRVVERRWLPAVTSRVGRDDYVVVCFGEPGTVQATHTE